jgi:hypothetical protein
MAEVFDIPAFRAAFPAFASTVLYPDATIQAAADTALCMMSMHGCGCDTLAWQLMVAHILLLGSRNASGGGVAGIVTSATIDKVSVSLQTLQTTSDFNLWLAQTPYGLQLLALLSKCSSGGAYVGGRAERAAFRSAGGRFPNGGRIW